MDSFLSSVVDKFIEVDGDQRRDMCVVFPTRRACLIFRNQLAKATNKTTWSPQIVSITDFMAGMSPYRILSDNELLLELYPIYKKFWPDTSFSKYINWGRIMLTDFDDIDKQLVDPEVLFTSIKDFKNIEKMFQPDSEELEWLQGFSASFNKDELSKLQSEFSKTWDKLYPVYNTFNQHLDSKSEAYIGKAYRKLVSQLSSDSSALKHSHYIFAGLHGLSRSEELMISSIKQHRKCEVIWDDDKYYTSRAEHEAGKYFRHSNLKKEFPLSDQELISNTNRQVDIIGVPLSTGQARVAGKMIGDILSDPKANPSNSVVVLPDEKVLPVLLNSIPDIKGEINVTMGYPVEGTTLDSFVRKLNNLYSYGIKSDNKNQKYYYRYVEDILTHPVLKFQPAKDSSEIFSLFFSENEISTFYKVPYSNLIFRKLDSASDVFNYIIEILDHLQTLNSNTKTINRLYELSLHSLLSELKTLKNLLSDYWNEIDIPTSWQLVMETVRSIRIPLSGEPVQGIQVMGFLETRALDFEDVTILSMNEKVMPGNKTGNSYIPYSLRKAFSIPSNDDREASVSFHLHRLLQRSKHVTLLYDSSPGNKSGGEESRYLLQLKHELEIQSNGNSVVNTKSIQFDLPGDLTKPISIQNNSEIIDHLTQRFTEQNEKIKYLSPSALSTYINCSLQFYFKYVVGLYESDENNKTIDQKLFGTLLHDTMYELYKPYVKTTLNSETLDIIIAKIPKTIDTVLVQHLKVSRSHLEGYNLLQVGALEILVNRVIEKDREYLPIELISLEEEYIVSFNSTDIKVNIGGKFDRVDRVNGITRIVDYKTGNVQLSSPADLEKIFSEPIKKELFQVYLYKNIFDQINPDVHSVAGFYTLRSISSGFIEPKNKKFNIDDIMPQFNENLSDMIHKIFDPKEIFSKTRSLENCKYCDFKDICNR